MLSNLFLMKRIGLISDTHGYLDRKVFKYFSDCDEIWHAGDIGSLEVTDELKKFKPLRCVYGNIDGGDMRREFKETLFFELEGMTFLMTHIGGKPYKYSTNIIDELRVKSPQVFICGHSHILKVQYDKTLNLLYLNPGAAGVHGFHKVRTLLRFSVHEGKLSDMEVIELGLRSQIKWEF